jgi:predicted ABC-type ATPase
MEQFGLEIPDAYINPDDIEKELVNADRATGLGVLKDAAQKKSRDLRKDYREKHISHSFETVLSHPSTIVDLKLARQAGYSVSVIYVCTEDANINVGRVRSRVALGGHGVDEHKIRSRYARCLNLLPRVVEEATVAWVVDTSRELQPRIAFQKRLYEVELTFIPYLHRQLIMPLAERKDERAELSAQFPGLAEPDEYEGSYEGLIVQVNRHYYVQQVEGVHIRHDRSMLVSGTFTPIPADTALVNYTQGAAHVVLS